MIKLKFEKGECADCVRVMYNVLVTSLPATSFTPGRRFVIKIALGEDAELEYEARWLLYS